MKIEELIEKLDSYIPDGDGYNSEYAHTLSEAVEMLKKLNQMFIDTEKMIAYLGAEGVISTRSELVLNVLDRLHDVDPI